MSSAGSNGTAEAGSEDKWVMDVTMLPEDRPPGVYPFCPVIEDVDGNQCGIQVGMTLVTDRPPGEFVGFFHADGREAAERWMYEHAQELLEAGLVRQSEVDPGQPPPSAASS